MQCFRQISELAGLRAPVCWAMGFFDGLHLGHSRVIGSATAPGALRGVVTFEPHPLALLQPETAPLLLMPDPTQKRVRMEALGVDVLLTLPFTRELADMAAAEFLEQLYNACPNGIHSFSVGSNWHFGKNGSGNVLLLRELAAARGSAVCENGLLTLPGGEVVCSSSIRKLLAAGDLRGVENMLGRPFEIAGCVEHGQHLARKLGFPTANITLPPNAALPPFGVYEVTCEYQGTTLHGIANLGLRPTIRETVKQVRLETHFLDFSGDLYAAPLLIALRRFLRPEKTFPHLEALTAQIRADIVSVEQAHGICRAL